jgi:hypothetical protein
LERFFDVMRQISERMSTHMADEIRRHLRQKS